MKNQSLFSKSMRKSSKKDFLALWQETFSAGDEYKTKRALDDDIERQFWVLHSKKYDQQPSLYDYAPEVFDHLLNLTGKNKKLIEFGCGTGKFTLPMAQQSRYIFGVDFSKEMLNIAQEKIDKETINNVQFIEGKFEKTDLPQVDCIYGINANYRMFHLDYAIKKMMALASERVIFVWTMQRSIYDAILAQTQVKGIGRKQEYIYLVNLFYDMGLDPNLKIKSVIKPMAIDDIFEHYRALKDLSQTYGLSYEKLRKAFDKKVERRDNQLIYYCAQTVVFIYLDSKHLA